MLLATLLAAAAWTAPVPLALPDYGATASGAFGGSAMGGEFEATATIARRSGSGFAPFTPITAEDPSETVGATGLADNGEAIVVSVRRHRPTRRIRATIVAPGRHARGRAHDLGPVAFGDPAHAGGRRRRHRGRRVGVARPEGWRVQAAVRRPGAAALRPAAERLAADQPAEPLAVDRRRRGHRRPRRADLVLRRRRRLGRARTASSQRRSGRALHRRPVAARQGRVVRRGAGGRAAGHGPAGLPHRGLRRARPTREAARVDRHGRQALSRRPSCSRAAGVD